MSAAIEICTGRVHIFRQGNGQGGVGFYRLDPSIEVGNGAKVLIMGAPINYQEIVAPAVTLDDKQFLYVFGSAWTEATVQCKLLMGENSNKSALADVIKWYEQNRVSARRDSPVRFSAGDKGVEMYLTGLRCDAVNPEFNTQDFVLTFHLKAD